jgi:hypothetical protein
MNYLRAKGWDDFQRYRRDRGAPPWIALHRRLQRDVEWINLTSEQRGWLVDIWMLAAERDGQFPADPALIQKLCGMDRAPDLATLQHFIDQPLKLVAVQCPSTVGQTDSPETETETYTERERAGTRKPQKRGSRLDSDWRPSDDLISWAMTERTDLDIQRVIDSFTDYWRAKPGQSGCKLDWDATFRNWVRNEQQRRVRERENPVQARERRNREALLRG